MFELHFSDSSAFSWTKFRSNYSSSPINFRVLSAKLMNTRFPLSCARSMSSVFRSVFVFAHIITLRVVAFAFRIIIIIIIYVHFCLVFFFVQFNMK